MAYSPLGKGELLCHPAVTRVAAAAGVTPAQALLRWSLDHGFVPIPRSASAAHVAENAAAATLPPLAAEHRAALDALNEERHLCWDGATIT